MNKKTKLKQKQNKNQKLTERKFRGKFFWYQTQERMLENRLRTFFEDVSDS